MGVELLGVRKWARVDVSKVALVSQRRLAGKVQIRRDAGFERGMDGKDGDVGMKRRIAESVIVHGNRVCDIIIIPKRLTYKIGRVAVVITDFV